MLNQIFPCRLAVLTGVLCFTMPAGADEVTRASVDRGFQEQAPEILNQLKEKGYKNVGVLKFRIKKGNDPISDRVGTLNMFLADRLEMALILANSNNPAKQLGILKKASLSASRIPGASHVSAAGREKLFQADYPLAWGDEQVKPDAFLTGVAQISTDLRKITIGILVFDSSGGPLAKVVTPFEAVTTPAMLGEAGESYSVRGAFDSARPEMIQAAVAEAAARVKSEGSTHPLADQTTPVSLEIKYDDKVIPLEFKNGKAFVAEPQQGQKVTLVLKRTEHATGRLAVVVKVNGENTLERQRLRDVECRKWVLEPGAAPIPIEGYQIDQNHAERFEVLSDALSASTEMNYGADVGMISMSVFREKGALPESAPPKSSDAPKPDPPKPESPKLAKQDPSGPPAGSPGPPADLPADTAEDLAALSRGVYPTGKAKNLAALKRQLREAGRDSESRGLIVQGQQVQNEVRRVQFDLDPTPIQSAAILYYSAKSGTKAATN